MTNLVSEKKPVVTVIPDLTPATPPAGPVPVAADEAARVYLDAGPALAALAPAGAGPTSILTQQAPAQKPIYTNPVYLNPDAPKLDGNKLLRLIDRPRTNPLLHVRQYADLGDRYTPNDKGHYVKAEDGSDNGIHTWSDLKSFMGMVLFDVEEKELQIVIDQYNFPSLEAPDWFLTQIQNLAQKSGKQISIKIKGDSLDNPKIYFIDEKGINQTDLEYGVAAFGLVTDTIRSQLSPEQKILFEALTEAHDDDHDAHSDWGTFLADVLSKYNQKASAQGLVEIDLNKRTSLFSMIENLETTTRELGLRALLEKGFALPQGLNLLSPLSHFRILHEPNTSSENCWFSIGAGQMIATLEFARHLMDIGVLPLDFRLMGVDLQESLTWEVNEKGTNRVFLGDVAVNPEGRKQIYILNVEQRDEALARYRPEVILLNLKASYLGGIVDDSFVDIVRTFSPIMAMPAKAYDDQGLLPYLEIYDKLIQMGETSLAAALLVIGGFFAAPDILKQDEVEMTLAGESETALDRMLRGMTPHKPDAGGRADWPGIVNIKKIASAALAAALQAGGANKNILTYRSGHLLMDAALELVGAELAKKAGQKILTDSQRDRLIRELNQKIADEAKNNIAVSEEATAKYIASYPFKSGITMSTDHLWSPRGLEKDFINCLPVSAYELVAIAETLVGIGLDLKNGDIKLTKALKNFDQVIERVRDKWGRGTRNNRDGDIDSAIKNFHQFLLNGFISMALKPFWDEHYPEVWKDNRGKVDANGKRGQNGQQEGRNGIGPVIKYALEHGLTLPGELYEAWNLYNPGNPRVVPTEKIKKELMVEGVNHIWGLDINWVERTFKALSLISHNLDLFQARSGSESPSRRFFTKGLAPLHALLSEIKPEEGAVPEVTRRIGVIKERISVLIEMFGQKNIMPASLVDAANKFQTTVHRMLKMFRNANSISELLIRLRESAQDLYWVELAIKQDLAVKFDLGSTDHEGGFREAADSVEMSATPAGMDISVHASVESPVSTKTHDGDGDPKASGMAGPINGIRHLMGDILPQAASQFLFDGALALQPQVITVTPPKVKPKLAIIKGEKADNTANEVSRETSTLRLVPDDEIIADDNLENITDSVDNQPANTDAVLAPEWGALGVAGRVTLLPDNVTPLFGVK